MIQRIANLFLRFPWLLGALIIVVVATITSGGQ